MKRIFTFGLLVAAAFALTNCAQKEAYTPVQDEAVETVTLQLVAELPVDTKTINSGLNTMWCEGDALKLYYEAGSISGEFDGEFVTNGDGIFTGDLTIKSGLQSLIKVTAVYPYETSGAIPASTVQEGYNSMAHLDGANCPLRGEIKPSISFQDWKLSLTTPKLKLEHATSVVKVVVTNNSLAPIVVENVSMRVGSDVKGTTKVEGGEALPVGEKAEVYVVIEPCTIDPADGELVFAVNDGTQEIVLENPVTLEPGKINTMNFDYKGDLPELYAVATVDVEMVADRVVPSVKTLIDFEFLKEWATNLKNHENIEGLLQEVLVAIAAGDLDSAYAILNGIPGFEHQVETILGSAKHIEAVNYTATGYLASFVEDIKAVKDVESLLNILDEFMRYYEVSGTKDQVLGGIGKLSDYAKDFTSFISQWMPNGGGILGQTIIKWFEDKIAELINVNMVDIMAAAVADPDSVQAKILDWMFSQTTIRDAILDSIVKVVEGIENANKDQIEQTNNALKEAAILSAKTTALYKAKIAAHKDVEVKFDMLNQNEIDKLNNSIWGIFRGILDWDKTKALFEELQIVKVYDVLQQIAQKIEEFVIYEEGAYTITSENCEVVSPSEL